MSEKMTVEELKALSDELNIYGIPLILGDVTVPLNEAAIVPRLVESTWQLMNVLRETGHTNSLRQEEADRQKFVNRQLETEISLLKRRLTKSNEKEKRSTDRADLATRELNSVTTKFDSNVAREKYEALAENEIYRKRVLCKDAEIADLKNKLQSALENGKISTRIRPKPLPSSEREAALKNVVCKFQEANTLLIEENLSLVRLLVNQDEEEDDEK